MQQVKHQRLNDTHRMGNKGSNDYKTIKQYKIEETADNEEELPKITESVNKKNTCNLRKNMEYAKCEEIKKILSDYDEETIIDFYTNHAQRYFLDNDQKAKILASLLPKNNGNLIKLYVHLSDPIPCELYALMTNLNFNYLSDRNETFLFSMKDKEINFCAKLLATVDSININQINIGNCTFLMKLMKNRVEQKYINNYFELVKVLTEKKFNFNVQSITGHTVLSIASINNSHLVFNFADFVKIEEYDITTEVYWLYLLLNNHYRYIHNYIHNMIKRKDSISILYRLFKSYEYASCDNDFLLFLIKWKQQISDNTTKSCLEYVDDNGNSIVHLMAQRRCKKSLGYINTHFPELKFKSNVSGKTICDLYGENRMENRLKNMIG